MFANSPRRFGALPIYLLLEGVSALLFQLVQTIYIVFYAKTVGLNAFQIVLMGTVFEATIFLFEIPTGIIADLYSRRLSVILGFLLTGISFVIEGAAPLLITVLAGEIISGVGETCLSGATEAWISDEIGQIRANQAFVRAGQIKQITGMVGIALSVALASIDLRLPMLVVGAAFLLLGLALIAFMPEDGFMRRADRPSRDALLAPLRSGGRLVRARPVLLVILSIGFIAAFHSEGFDHLWQKYLLDDFTLPSLGTLDPVVWFGVIGLSANLLSAGLSEIIRRRVNLSDHRATARALLILYGVQPVTILIFSLTGQFGLAAAAYCVTMALRWSTDPVNKAWLNQNLEPGVRATMFSLNAQVGAIGEILGGPPIGALAQIGSLRLALAACGAILALTLPLFGLTLRRKPVSEGS